MGDRDTFIQQLVAALKENESLSNGASSVVLSSPSSSGVSRTDVSSHDALETEKSPTEATGLFQLNTLSSIGNSEQLAKEAHTQLQYDYPQVQEASIEALAELYRRLAAEKSQTKVTVQVPITTTLLDGLTYLNDQEETFNSSGQQRRTRSSEGSGLLATAVLLLIFKGCLETSEGTGVNSLLKSLHVKQHQVSTLQIEEVGADAANEDQSQESIFVEKYAAQEDPDDLSEVYEGHLPLSWSHIDSRTQMTPPPSVISTKVEKLRYLASLTFTSSFAAVSMEKWEQWHLDDELAAIMRMLVEQSPEQHEDAKGTYTDAAPVALYGPRGEWSRYLYILRDHVLRFPSASRNALWRLKELVEFFRQRRTGFKTTGYSQHRAHQPQYLVYRVLAELAVSREFHQGAAQRAQQGLALVIQELLPLITDEVQQLAFEANSSKVQTRLETPKDKLVGEEDNGEEDDLVVVFLQLLHFMLFASSNSRTTTEKLHESGILRTLLALLPPVPLPGADNEQQTQHLEKTWFCGLLRLLGECALWHEGFAGYIVRVPKFAALISVLRERFLAEELLLAIAFHQHQVQVRWTVVDIWEVLTSPSLFPEQCQSFLEAMKKLQDAVFVLDCMEKVLQVLRPAMQKELQHSLQQIYARFTRAFEYPTFAIAESTRQQQFEQQALSDKGSIADEEKKEKKDEDRGQAEALQFTALRNKLRQSVKSLLAALSSGSSVSYAGRASSKLD